MLRPPGRTRRGACGRKGALSSPAVSFSKMTDGRGEPQAQSVPVGPFSGRGVRWPQNVASPPWTRPPSLISLPVKLNPGVLPWGTGSLSPWMCLGTPNPSLALASFQPFRMTRGRLKTPLTRPETVPENAGRFSVGPHVAASLFVGAVTSLRPFPSPIPWWLQWPTLTPYRGVEWPWPVPALLKSGGHAWV